MKVFSSKYNVPLPILFIEMNDKEETQLISELKKILEVFVSERGIKNLKRRISDAGFEKK